MESNKSKKWYKTWWGLIILFLFWPFSLSYYIWTRKIEKNKKIGLLALVWIVFGFGMIVNSQKVPPTTSTQTSSSKVETSNIEQSNTPEPDIPTIPEPTNAPTKVTKTPTPIQTKQPEIKTSPPTSSETVSQKNALKKAKSYLDYTGFSHGGLVAQLEFEQFSYADAVYGADNSGANWNEQAAKKAKSYMDYSAFSRGSLIEQLKYDKFTQEQAEYGASSVGL